MWFIKYVGDGEGETACSVTYSLLIHLLLRRPHRRRRCISALVTPPPLLGFLSFFLFLVRGGDVSGGGKPVAARPGGGRDRRRSTHHRHILRGLLGSGNCVQAFASRFEGSLHSRPPRPRRGSRIHWLLLLSSFFFETTFFFFLWYFLVSSRSKLVLLLLAADTIFSFCFQNMEPAMEWERWGLGFVSVSVNC